MQFHSKSFHGQKYNTQHDRCLFERCLNLALAVCEPIHLGLIGGVIDPRYLRGDNATTRSYGNGFRCALHTRQSSLCKRL